MTTGVVTFDYRQWALAYPELAASVPSAQQYFDQAQLYLNNTPSSIVRDVSQRTILLNMLTAHIAALNAPLNCQPSPQIVGRISSASEGSVSVQTTNDYAPGTRQWYQQTKYGSAYYAATARFRTMQYVPGCQPSFAPYGYGGPYGQ